MEDEAEAGPPRSSASAHVFVLRPQPGASRTAARLAAGGYAASVLPLTRILALEPHVPSGVHDALVFSSRNGVRHGAAALRDHLPLPAFCVGAQTAAAAHARHFRVAATAPTAATLLPLIAAAGVRSVLYACGRLRRPDIEEGLARAAISCAIMECYDASPIADAVERLIRQVEETAAAGSAAVILLHAPSAAMMLAPAAQALAASGARLLCLSEAVRDALAPSLKAFALSAAAPDEDALLGLLAKTLPARLFVAADMQAP